MKKMLKILTYVFGALAIFLLGISIYGDYPRHKKSDRADFMVIYANEEYFMVPIAEEEIYVLLQDSEFADKEVDILFPERNTHISPQWHLMEESENVFTIERGYFSERFLMDNRMVYRLRVGINNRASGVFQITCEEYDGTAYVMDVYFE